MTFSDVTPGVKKVAVDLFNPENESSIFADGFESGNTSAWTDSVP